MPMPLDGMKEISVHVLKVNHLGTNERTPALSSSRILCQDSFRMSSEGASRHGLIVLFFKRKKKKEKHKKILQYVSCIYYHFCG